MSIAGQLEALERAIREGEGEEAAAAAVREAVVAGTSANGVLERLVAALDSMYSTAARADVALAMTIDLIRRGDLAGWLALRAPRLDELEDALIRADEAGFDVRAAVLALPPAAQTSPVVPAVVRWCLRERVARTRDLVANLALENVVAFARLLYDKHESLAPWVARLGEVLSGVRDSPMRAGAAELVRWAVQQGCELGAAVREALRGALDDAAYFHKPADEAAYALALTGEPGLDRDPRAAVRMGAWRGRPSFLALLDPEPHNRRLIARELLEQIRGDADLCPSRDETQCLFAELLDPVVAEVVYAVIDRGEVAATVVAGVEPHGAARHVVAAARAVLAHEPPPLCRTCRDIPRRSSSRNFTPPEAATRGLEPALDLTQEGERRSGCLECGTAYHLTCYDASDLYIQYAVTLERLPPDDPAVIARWRDRLDHPETWARRDAAWIVARAAVSAGDTATIDELVAHRDVDVRRETWQLVPGRAMARALDDPDDEIRSLAAGRLVESGDAAVLVDLLGRDPVVADTTAMRMNRNASHAADVVQALRARMRAARQQPRPDVALESVCRVLGSALANTPDREIVAEAVEIVIGAPPAIQACVLHVLAGSGPHADTSALDDRLVALLRQPETRHVALDVLEVRATAGQSLRVEVLDTLASVLDPDYSGLNARAMELFVRAVRTPATQAAGFRGLFALLRTGIETTAASKLHELARELPLGDAAPGVMTLAASTRHGYVRQELIHALLVDAKRRGDRALVAALVEHSHPGVARQARSALRDST